MQLLDNSANDSHPTSKSATTGQTKSKTSICPLKWEIGPLNLFPPCGLTDKAPDYGSGDYRFKSCHGSYHKSCTRRLHHGPGPGDADNRQCKHDRSKCHFDEKWHRSIMFFKWNRTLYWTSALTGNNLSDLVLTSQQTFLTDTNDEHTKNGCLCVLHINPMVNTFKMCVCQNVAKTIFHASSSLTQFFEMMATAENYHWWVRKI